MESVENIKLTEEKKQKKNCYHTKITNTEPEKKTVRSGRALRALESFLFKLQMFVFFSCGFHLYLFILCVLFSIDNHFL